jgi:hypothetical protein|mmetsp:Transcript_40275/g.72329  ORF Transcript_40275/g.72329 Transcript_40275/m.72329 type:complete len:92 (+) Transcript_40275:135-410(+)|eukprot:CAMPEP_0177761656 /NCGR_PEP_ID=MMETSP0491_2-20121128/5922_1 /TAXON_ID=63592 /ORGANISM="Tetraselmis chuii, Strain PLY429" /LENGTH=91 /DNA_ID=CAMNT_0019277647 /DNA_START=128 /DNA_END=403 /DNA_ORIENTATION=+
MGEESVQQQPAAASSFDETLEWIRENKLKAVGSIWATGVSGSLAYQWTKNIPTSMKLIHSRVYAQAITLGALGLAAVVETHGHLTKDSSEE